MFQLLIQNDYVKNLQEKAKTVIYKERQKYSKILLIAVDYAIEHKLIINSAKNDTDIKKHIEEGSLDQIELYSEDPQKAAKEISLIICKEYGNDLRLNVVFFMKEYAIEYDFRMLINIYFITGEVKPLIIDIFLFFPTILEQLGELYTLIDFKKFNDWQDCLPNLEKRNKLLKLPEPTAIDVDNKQMQDMRTLLLQYGKFLYTAADPQFPLEIVITCVIEDFMTEIKNYLAKYNDIDAFYKVTEMCIPQHTQLKKYSIFLTNQSRVFINVFNLGTYNIIAYEKKKNKIAAPHICAYISLINMYISLNKCQCLRLIDTNIYETNLKNIKLQLYEYEGIYVDDNTQKKIQMLASRKYSSEKINFICSELEE